jgi:hypothetical protein
MILLPRFKHGKFVPANKDTSSDDETPGKDDIKGLTAKLNAAKAAGNRDAARYYALAIAEASK